MKQQVNLYQPLFRRQRKVFSAVTMAQLAALVALGLLALYGFGYWQERAARVDVATLVAQRDQAQQQVEQLTRDLAARRDMTALNQQLQQTETVLAAKRQLQRWLAEQGSRQRGGFSDHLAALARQHRPGVQLDTIMLGNGGEQIRLDGQTLETADLVRYLRRLGSEPAFAGVEFRTVRVERVDGPAAGTDDSAESDVDAVAFVVASARLDESEATP